MPWKPKSIMDTSVQDEDQAEQILLTSINENYTLTAEEKDLPDWALKYNSFNSIDKNVYAILGKHNNQYFYIYRFLDLEGAEIFIPIEQKIYNQWRWKDNDNQIEFPFPNPQPTARMLVLLNEHSEFSSHCTSTSVDAPFLSN